MAKYQVVVVERPDGWAPRSLDDAPPQLRGVSVHAGSDALFDAVRQTVEYNQAAPAEQRRWAVVIEQGAGGRLLREGRLCTPIAYKVTAFWRPEGWEPTSPLDVPRCLWQVQAELEAESLPYSQALQTVRSLNQQSMDMAGPMWYVLVAVENEAISESRAFDATGTETTTRVRRLHVVCPESGGRGDCSHCPAHALPCAAPVDGGGPQTATERQVNRA